MAIYRKSIVASHDDGYLNNSAWDSTASTLVVMFTNGTMTGLRFPVNIPKGSIIRGAELSLYQKNTNSTAVTIRISRIAGTNQPPILTDVTNLVTRNSVSWTAPSFTDNGGYVSTPNMGVLLQEFIDQPGYNPGNYIGFRMQRTAGAGSRSFSSVEGGFPPILICEYTPAIVSPIITSGIGAGKKKTSIIQMPDITLFSSTKFKFVDADGSTFSIKTNDSGMVGRRPPNVSSASTGYLEIDLPTKKYQLKIYNEFDELIADTTIDQRPKGTYGRKIARNDAGGVNLVDTTETSTARGARVEAQTHVTETRTSRGAKIVSGGTRIEKTSRGARIDNR